MSSLGGVPHFDPAMLGLFRKELSTETARLEEALAILAAGGRAPETYEKMWLAARQLKSSAHIMHFSSLIALADSIEELSLHMHKVADKDATKFHALFHQAIDCIKKIAKQPESELVSLIPRRDAGIEKLANVLKDACSSTPEKVSSSEGEEPRESELTTDPALMGVFKVELENQSVTLSNALLSLEQSGMTDGHFDVMLRAIHSIKGAARVVGLSKLTSLAHLVEDVLVASKKHLISLNESSINILFAAIDFFVLLSKQPQATIQGWISQQSAELDSLKEKLQLVRSGKQPAEIVPPQTPAPIEAKDAASVETSNPIPGSSEPAPAEHSQERVLRVTAESLNRLMGLAGESLVESRWLEPFSESLSRIRKSMEEVSNQIDTLRGSSQKGESPEQISFTLKTIAKKGDDCQKILKSKLSDLELYINRNSSLSDRLYHEVIDSRMRSFGDGVKALPRMVRDMAHQLGKKVHFEIRGKSTPVDRDILELLETPLAHLLRNAIDHGIETPDVRAAQGKPPEGTLILTAEHVAGMLSITVSDDGAGLDPELIRKMVIEKGMTAQAVAEKLTNSELIDFLFLPGFSTSKEVTEISGRGVGLNAVQNMVQSVSGSIHTSFVKGKGMRFNLQLPLTLSVIRALLTEISREPYAIPLNRLVRAIVVPKEQVELIENRQYIHFEGKNVGLISGSQILGFEEKKSPSPQISVIIINDRSNSYGVVVDKFIGEKEFVLHSIDSRLGKVQDVSSGAFLEDGSPVLVIDVEDVVRTIDNILFTGSVSKLTYGGAQEPAKKSKRILVIDDSITVREVECRLLRNKGYDVDTAINGMEGWNALRMGAYDLVITDVDMPRMNGIELVRAIKGDARLKSLPVMIVSYKEREDDRLQGLQAGANYYLTKSGFHDQALLDAVLDLIGEP